MPAGGGCLNVSGNKFEKVIDYNPVYYNSLPFVTLPVTRTSYPLKAYTPGLKINLNLSRRPL